MSNFSDWSTLTYVNGTTPALNAVNLNKNENALEDVMNELNYSNNWSLKSILEYGLMNGMKEVIKFNDSSVWSSSGTISLSNTYDNVLGGGLKITETDNSSGTLWIWQSGLSDIDTTEFNSGLATVTTDYIVWHVYISDDTLINSIGIRLGDDDSNFYYFTITSTYFNTGWNALKLRMDYFTTTGSPTGFDSINYVSVYVNTAANAQDEYIIIDGVHVERNDTSRVLMQPWWMDDGSGNYDVEPYMVSRVETMIYDDDILNRLAFTIQQNTTISFAEILCTVNSFSVKAECYSKATGYGCSIVWLISSVEYIRVDVRSSSLIIYEYDSGGTDVATVALDSTIAINDRMELYVDKIDNVIRAELRVDGQTPVFAAWETGFAVDDAGCVGFIKPSSDYEYVVTDFVVGHNHANLPPFMSNGLELMKIKKVTESVTSSTTIQADDELWLKLPANTLFEVTVVALVYSSSATPDIKCDFSITGDYINWGRYVTAAPTTTSNVLDTNVALGYWSADSYDASYGTDGTANENVITEKTYIKTGISGAIVYYRWGQNTSNATATSVRYNSFIKAKKIG